MSDEVDDSLTYLETVINEFLLSYKCFLEVLNTFGQSFTCMQCDVPVQPVQN